MTFWELIKGLYIYILTIRIVDKPKIIMEQCSVDKGLQ